jgi:hypothetical protein
MSKAVLSTALSAAIIALVSLPTTAEARVALKREALRAELTAARTGGPELLPPGVAPQVAAYTPAAYPVSVATPCITYRGQRALNVCCGCEPPIKTVLLVKDPVTCCCVEVPICLPACCTDVPEVCAREGLLGRGIVTHDWCCGFSVKVMFRARGDVVVTYSGR